MVIDSSAVVAILQAEPGSDGLIATVEANPDRFISAATLVEVGIVMQARFGDHGEREVGLFMTRLRIQVIPVTEGHAELALSGYRRFGKGNHPAGLNFGDCFAYALAIALDEPLLFTGEDFARTDVRPAIG